jgi:ABC-type Fe3+ transport system permease subunit
VCVCVCVLVLVLVLVLVVLVLVLLLLMMMMRFVVSAGNGDVFDNRKAYPEQEADWWKPMSDDVGWGLARNTTPEPHEARSIG